MSHGGGRSVETMAPRRRTGAAVVPGLGGPGGWGGAVVPRPREHTGVGRRYLLAIGMLGTL